MKYDTSQLNLALQSLSQESTSLRLALAAEEQVNSTTVSRLLAQEHALRENLSAAIARATHAEAALAKVPGDLAAARVEASMELSSQLDATKLRLQQALNDMQRLEDWDIERKSSIERIGSLEGEIARLKEFHAATEVQMQRKNAADRESMRALLLDHMKQMKLELLEKTAGSMGDNMKRMVAEHEQLISELSFSSKKGEEFMTVNARLQEVSSSSSGTGNGGGHCAFINPSF